MKLVKKLQGLFPLGVLFLIVFFIMAQTKTGSIDFCGFGVDSNNLLYVGRFHTIEVYDDGTQVNAIPSPLNRGWYFSVTHDDQILVTNGHYLYTLDLNGNILQIGEDYHSQLAYKIQRSKSTTDNLGNTYKLKSFLGYKWITLNGKIVYKVPFADVITKLSYVVSFASLLIGIIAITVCEKARKKEDNIFPSIWS